MADPVLHIKDSYYFELPKVLYPYDYRSRRDFPDVWITLDPEFQDWEAERLYEALSRRTVELPAKDELLSEWRHWKHADHLNFAKPLKVFLEEKYQAAVQAADAWKTRKIKAAQASKDQSIESAKRLDFRDYVDHLRESGASGSEYFAFLEWRDKNEEAFSRAQGEARKINEWKEDKSLPEWSKAKIDAYNHSLSGKILIPQPFGTLRNFYEKESGFAISKYMVLQVVIGLVIVVVFSNLARRASAGGPPRGYLWNLLESFLVFIRDDVVRPSLGGHHGEGEHGDHGHDHSHAEHAGHGSEQAAAAHHAHAPPHSAGAAPAHVDDATRMLPVFWTIFFFVLGCNLFGMVPWLGAPSASFSVTTGLALVTLVVGTYCGIMKFGLLGHLGNQIPAMDLPWYMAIVIKPLVYAIEVMGLMIKHGVLAIRLLANMVAGHLVILGIMGVAFGSAAAVSFSDAPTWQWGVAATIAVLASTVFSLLELFVAFLQAYVFTFLSALFIGATLHKH